MIPQLRTKIHHKTARIGNVLSHQIEIQSTRVRTMKMFNFYKYMESF